MDKIKEILIGTNNIGKYKEICGLLPKTVKKYSLKEIEIATPEETGKTFEENSLIKASYFSKKTNLVCLSDDSGLEIDILKDAPGIYSSRWAGEKNNFNLAIEKVFKEMEKVKKDWKKYNSARFVCSLSLFWPDGKSYSSKGLIKASYFSKKTNLICLSDDSGLEIDLLKGEPGIYSSRWSGEKNNFNLAIEKVYKKMNNIKKDWKNNNKAQFVCSMTLFWPDGKSYSSMGIIEGKISTTKKGKKGFGYDPIFIPNGYNQTFGEIESKLKISIDHRFKAFLKIKKFFI